MFFKLFLICVALSIIVLVHGEERTIPKDDLAPTLEEAKEDDLETSESFFWPWFYKPWFYKPFGYGPYLKFKVVGGVPGYGYWGR